VNEWVFVGVWVLALVLACAGMIALLKARNVRRPLLMVLTITSAILVAMLVIVGPLFLLFMPPSVS